MYSLRTNTLPPCRVADWQRFARWIAFNRAAILVPHPSYLGVSVDPLVVDAGPTGARARARVNGRLPCLFSFFSVNGTISFPRVCSLRDTDYRTAQVQYVSAQLSMNPPTVSVILCRSFSSMIATIHGIVVRHFDHRAISNSDALWNNLNVHVCWRYIEWIER